MVDSISPSEHVTSTPQEIDAKCNLSDGRSRHGGNTSYQLLSKMHPEAEVWGWPAKSWYVEIVSLLSAEPWSLPLCLRWGSK